MEDAKVKELAKQRREVQKIDDKIIKLLDRRLQSAEKIGEIKKSENIPFGDQIRDSEIMSRIVMETEEPYTDYIKNIFESVVAQTTQFEEDTLK